MNAKAEELMPELAAMGAALRQFDEACAAITNRDDPLSTSQRMKALCDMESEQEPRSFPQTKSLDFTQDELFCLLDGLRWMQVSISKRPPQMRESMLSAMRKLNAAMGVKL